jgi:hypothetical protein
MKIVMTWFLLLLPLAAQEKPAAPAEAKVEEAPPAAEAKSNDPKVTWNADFGYRFRTDVRGSYNAYRSVVNLGEGPKLFGIDLSIANAANKLYDRIDIQANGWGGDPYNTARLDAKLDGVYRLSVDYRNIAYYNFLPSFADPTAATGVYLNQRSFDQKRRLANVELDIRPGKRFIPYVAWSHDAGRGSGISTFVTDGNEYPVAGVLGDKTDRIRGGVRMEFGKWHATLEQGGGMFEENDTYSTGPNQGNNTRPVLGQTLSLTSLAQAYAITGNQIYTKGLFTSNPYSWLDLTAQFLFTQPDTKTSYSITDSGQLILLSSLLFYNGQQGLTTADAKLPHSTGSLGGEIRPFRRLRILESWMTDRLHNASSAFFTEQILLSGNKTTPLLTPSAYDSAVWNYNQHQTDVLFEAFKWVTLRGGYRYVWGDASVRATPVFPQAAELGELKRHVGLAGVNVRVNQKISSNFDFEGSNGVKTYFRTGLQDYKKTKLRGKYQAFGSLLFSGSYTYLDNQNHSTSGNYDFQSRATSLNAMWTPWGGKRMTLLGEYTRGTLHSDIGIFTPQTLTLNDSFYRENFHSFTSALDLSCWKGAKVSLGGTGYVSSGSRPTEFYQPLVRMVIPLRAHWGLRTEWQYHSMSERFYQYESFGAHTFVIALQVH